MGKQKEQSSKKKSFERKAEIKKSRKKGMKKWLSESEKGKHPFQKRSCEWER
jgi:hypothetical protein